MPGRPTADAASRRTPRPRARGRCPLEIRGVHVTGALASLPGKFREYVGYKRYGLNTIELDVKDEGGEIGFRPGRRPACAHGRRDASVLQPEGARRPRAPERDLHDRPRRLLPGSEARAGRPDLAIQRRDGSVWTTSAGLGWVNPYDRRVWDYCVSVAEAAADAGFDQIMFDYVRFPSDGDIANAVYPARRACPEGA